MNERYIFRGKRLNGSGWVVGDRVRRKSRFAQQLDATLHISDEYGTLSAIDPATVGQCTGLRDKNGTLIFEGDIVKLCDTNPILFIVSIEMNKYGWACVFRYTDDGKIVKGAFLHRCEVIGNIHDNPELLKGA